MSTEPIGGRAPRKRSDAVEMLVGLCGMVGCVGARFGVLVAIFVASAALFIFGAWGRRIL